MLAVSTTTELIDESTLLSRLLILLVVSTTTELIDDSRDVCAVWIARPKVSMESANLSSENFKAEISPVKRRDISPEVTNVHKAKHC